MPWCRPRMSSGFRYGLPSFLPPPVFGNRRSLHPFPPHPLPPSPLLDQYEVRTDDITIICIYVDSTGEVASAAAPTPPPPVAPVGAPTIEIPVAKDAVPDDDQLRPPEATSPVAPFTVRPSLQHNGTPSPPLPCPLSLTLPHSPPSLPPIIADADHPPRALPSCAVGQAERVGGHDPRCRPQVRRPARGQDPRGARLHPRRHEVRHTLPKHRHKTSTHDTQRLMDGHADESGMLLCGVRSNFLFRNLSEEKREAIAAIMTKVRHITSTTGHASTSRDKGGVMPPCSHSL